MAYNILKDISFYGYSIVFLFSAIIFINSIKNLMADTNKEENIGENENKDKIAHEKIETPDQNTNIDSNILLEVKDDEKVEIKEDDNIEKIVIKNPKEEELFVTASSLTSDKEQPQENYSKVVEFFDALSSNLKEIKNSLQNSVVIKKIESIELRLVQIENEIKNLKDNLSIANINYENNKVDISKLTPRYILKYIEDIINDYEAISKENIRKRLDFIVDELKKIEKDL